MECSEVKKNINKFLKGQVSRNDKRKMYYHLKTCNDCKEVLFDEFSFFTTFNDLDVSLDFNYENKLEEILKKIETDIVATDDEDKKRYLTISILICICLIILLIIAIKLVYR